MLALNLKAALKHRKLALLKKQQQMSRETRRSSINRDSRVSKDGSDSSL